MPASQYNESPKGTNPTKLKDLVSKDKAQRLLSAVQPTNKAPTPVESAQKKRSHSSRSSDVPTASSESPSESEQKHHRINQLHNRANRAPNMAIIEEKDEKDATIFMDNIKLKIKEQGKRRDSEISSINDKKQKPESKHSHI